MKPILKLILILSLLNGLFYGFLKSSDETMAVIKVFGFLNIVVIWFYCLAIVDMKHKKREQK